MIRGMTGKSSLRFSTDFLDVEMEIRSVNSRFFEFRIKTPARYAALEMDTRKIASQKLGRGKIDFNLRINEKEAQSAGLSINMALAKSYLEASRKVAEELNLTDSISLKDILSFSQVLNSDISDVDDSTLKLLLEQFEKLIDQMLPMMIEEGKSTLEDVQNSLNVMVKSLEFVKIKYPQVLDKYKSALRDRVLEVSSLKPSEERLSLELEMFASRTAINEEIVRLDNHIRVMQDILLGKRPETSKELDFIGQEMNREVNTIASKSSDFEITEQTIILKSEIEKMREQFRNLV